MVYYSPSAVELRKLHVVKLLCGYAWLDTGGSVQNLSHFHAALLETS
jgi:hypothetical protein